MPEGLGAGDVFAVSYVPLSAFTVVRRYGNPLQAIGSAGSWTARKMERLLHHMKNCPNSAFEVGNVAVEHRKDTSFTRAQFIQL